MGCVILNGALHYQRPRRILLMVWNTKFYNAVRNIKEDETYVSLSINNNVVTFRRSKEGVKLHLNKPLVKCSGNRLVNVGERSSFFEKSNYIRVKVKIIPNEWDLKNEDFLTMDKIAEKAKYNNKDEETITLHAGIRFFENHGTMTIFNKPFAEKISKLKDIRGIAYWGNNDIIVSIGRGYKFTPVASHGQVKLTITNLMNNQNYRKFLNEKNWILSEIELNSFSKIWMNYTDFFAETKEQKQLAEAFYQLGYKVKRDTYTSKYGADISIENSTIEITNIKPSADKRKNVLAGSRWGGIASRILKILRCASEIKCPHFIIINKKWEFVDGKSFVKYYKEWLKNFHNVYLMFADFSNVDWAIKTAAKIISIRNSYDSSS